MKRILASVIIAFSVVALVGVSAKDEKAKCPISGKAAKDDISLNVNGKVFKFCCNNCPKAFAKKIRVKDEGADGKSCPISNKDAGTEVTLLHATAQKVAFCCNNCPKGYAKKNKITFTDKGADGKKCPLSGKPAKADHKLVINGEATYFCCPNCPKNYLKKTYGVAKIADKTEKCPISGKPTKEATTLIVMDTKKVYFCSEGCVKPYIKKKVNAQ